MPYTAEQIQELERRAHYCVTHSDGCDCRALRYAKLEQENEALRQALEAIPTCVSMHEATEVARGALAGVQSSTQQPITPEVIDVIVASVRSNFRCFGGGRASQWNPIAHMLAEEPPQFAAGVGVRQVVQFVLMQAAKHYSARITAQCKICEEEIEHDGTSWKHIGDYRPRHPAVPADEERL
jgi:hypothetical protein